MPTPRNLKVTLHPVPITSTHKFQLRQRVKPSLWRPPQQRVFAPTVQALCYAQINALALVLIRHGKDIGQRGERKQQRGDVEQQPEPVPAPAEPSHEGAVPVRRPAAQPESQDPGDPDDDEACPRGAVGRVALVDGQVGGEAGHLGGLLPVVGGGGGDDSKGFVAKLREIADGSGDERQLDRRGDHDEADADLEREGCGCHFFRVVKGDKIRGDGTRHWAV